MSSLTVPRCDTSVGTGTAVVDESIEADETTIVVTSLSIVELASALRRKHNRGHLSKSAVDGLLAAFFEEALDQFTIVALDETRFERALDLVLIDDLRTLDGLQLAAALDIAADLEIAFVCADRDHVAVAADHELETIDPTDDDSLDAIDGA